MKVIKRILVSLCLMLSFGAVACDLSHKHYTDNFGVCKNCHTDIAVMIKKDVDNEYLPTDFMLQFYTDTFLKFVANGEDHLTIKIECEGADIESIVLYSMSDDYIASKYDKSNPVLECNESLVQGETYYIRIKSSGAADATAILEA